MRCRRVRLGDNLLLAAVEGLAVDVALLTRPYIGPIDDPRIVEEQTGAQTTAPPLHVRRARTVLIQRYPRLRCDASALQPVIASGR